MKSKQKKKIKTIKNAISEQETTLLTYNNIIKIIEKEQNSSKVKIEKLEDKKRDLETWYGYGKKYQNAELKIEEQERICDCFYTVIEEVNRIKSNFNISIEDKKKHLKYLLGE